MNLKDLLFKRVFNCPNCQKKLRVPIKLGKVLRINCQKCQASFDLSFKLPILSIFKWHKGQSIKNNLIMIANNFKTLDTNSKKSLLPLIILLLISTYFLF